MTFTWLGTFEFLFPSLDRNIYYYSPNYYHFQISSLFVRSSFAIIPHQLFYIALVNSLDGRRLSIEILKEIFPEYCFIDIYSNVTLRYQFKVAQGSKARVGIWNKKTECKVVEKGRLNFVKWTAGREYVAIQIVNQIILKNRKRQKSNFFCLPTNIKWLLPDKRINQER